MKRTIEFKTTVRKRGLVSLAILFALSVACQDSQSNNTSAPRQSEQPAEVATASANGQLPNSATNLPVKGTEEKDATKPGIQITEVPTKGAGPDRVETIAGTVSGVKINECKVVVFARTNTWFVQPYIDSSDTSINDDNTWRNDTHLGSRYAALLVKKSYKPPTTTGELPNVGGVVLAIAIVNARE